MHCIGLPSWAEEAAAFDRADRKRNIELAVASAASTTGIQLRKAMCNILSQRAPAEGAPEMVLVLSGVLGWVE